MDGIADGKICDISTTWGDMDIDKSTAKYGTALRNKWDTVRAQFVKAKTEWNSATKAHNNAIAAHQRSMAGFTTALGIEAQNTLDTCRSAHKQYALLVRDVQSNVNTRKQTYVAGLVIQCYVDNITSNAGAKKCADGARGANVSKWNINAGSLAACASNASNQNKYGPKGWKATSDNCKDAVVRNKEKADKKAAEAAQKKKEKDEKARAAELKAKESAVKTKEKNDKAAARKEKADKDEKKSKELSSKEKTSKEKANKAVLRVTRHAWHGWINNWDGNMGWHTGGATFVSGLHSTHNNGREDRLFKPLVTTFGANQRSHHWHGWINNWDHRFDFSCPTDQAIIGFTSYHSNHKEDRRWKVLCSTFHGVKIRGDGWPGWQTNWDATWSLSCGHKPMVGISSYHDNGKEDRRWRIRCGTMSNRL